MATTPRNRAFEFQYTPTETNREAITNRWHKHNLRTIEVPQLARIAKRRKRSFLTVHKRAADQLRALWAQWEYEGLLSRIVTFNGAWVARLIRGGHVLSNHA